MAASIESRTPLLDYRLVELALRIPDAVRFQGRDAKGLLREAVGGWLPPAVVDRRDKRGFPTPLQRWRASPALTRLVRSLSAADRGGVFTQAFVEQPERLEASQLWTVLMVNGWLGAHTG